MKANSLVVSGDYLEKKSLKTSKRIMKRVLGNKEAGAFDKTDTFVPTHKI